MYIMALLCPALAVIARGKITQGLALILLQCTILGWLPATLVAISVVNETNIERTIRREIRSTQFSLNGVTPQTSMAQEVKKIYNVEPKAYLSTLAILSACYIPLAVISVVTSFNIGLVTTLLLISIASLIFQYGGSLATFDGMVDISQWGIKRLIWYWVFYICLFPFAIALFLVIKWLHFREYRAGYDLRIAASIIQKESELGILDTHTS